MSFHAASRTDLKGVPENHFDVVFASNLLEHLSPEEIASSLDSFLRALYLRSPFKPFSGQCLLIARKP